MYRALLFWISRLVSVSLACSSALKRHSSLCLVNSNERIASLSSSICLRIVFCYEFFFAEFDYTSISICLTRNLRSHSLQISPRICSPSLPSMALGKGLDLKKQSLQTDCPQNWHQLMCFSFWKVTTLQDMQSEDFSRFLTGPDVSKICCDTESIILCEVWPIRNCWVFAMLSSICSWS